MRHRKKPVVVEAIQFFDNVKTIMKLDRFMGGLIIDYKDKDNPKLKIRTLEGVMEASVGDYIIKGVSGEFYPCKPDIFEKTYEAVGK